MAHAHNEESNVVTPQPADKNKIRKIWKTAGILAFVTAIEFLIAFTVESHTIRIVTFVLLTIVKAFYIVAEFMHLKYEVKYLVWSIILPMLFVLWLIVALMAEGDNALELKQWIQTL